MHATNLNSQQSHFCCSSVPFYLKKYIHIAANIVSIYCKKNSISAELFLHSSSGHLVLGSKHFSIWMWSQFKSTAHNKIRCTNMSVSESQSFVKGRMSWFSPVLSFLRLWERVRHAKERARQYDTIFVVCAAKLSQPKIGWWHFLQFSSFIPTLLSSLVFVALMCSRGISQAWVRVTLYEWLASDAWWLYWCDRWLSSLPDSHMTFYTSVCLSFCLPTCFSLPICLTMTIEQREKLMWLHPHPQNRM